MLSFNYFLPALMVIIFSICPFTLARNATLASNVASPSSTAISKGDGVGSGGTLSGPPDVLLNVPHLSVGSIEVDVEDLKLDLNLNADIAGLVTINAGVAASIKKVNITITDVDAELELVVRLGHLVDIVNRVFKTIDEVPSIIADLGSLLPTTLL